MTAAELHPIISIVIPVYNYDCSLLVERLNEQLEALSISGEILLGDDASAPRYRRILETLEQKGLCTIYHAEKNIGVGAMRNRLAALAKGTFLLYLDSDTRPISEDFLRLYIEQRSPEAVVVGGFVYPPTPPSTERMLRYKYGYQVEMQPADRREKQPYDRFISMSFLIPKKIKEKVLFHEKGMGYEDALFGYTLQENNIPIKHIDNPVLHDLKETGKEFLTTTKRYVYNLYCIRHLLKGKGVALLKAYYRMKRMGLRRLVAFFYKSPFWREAIEKQLCSPQPQLRLFSFYKLAYLCHLAKTYNNHK